MIYFLQNCHTILAVTLLLRLSSILKIIYQFIVIIHNTTILNVARNLSILKYGFTGVTNATYMHSHILKGAIGKGLGCA